MPIRPENRKRYPADWPEISARVRAEAGNRCEGLRLKAQRRQEFIDSMMRENKCLRAELRRLKESVGKC